LIFLDINFPVRSRLRPFLENIFLEKFSRNSRKIEIPISFFYTFGILTTKMTTKMYTKLASIKINDEILSKVGGIRIWGKTSKNVKNCPLKMGSTNFIPPPENLAPTYARTHPGGINA
jgi:hypothetical protein